MRIRKKIKSNELFKNNIYSFFPRISDDKNNHSLRDINKLIIKRFAETYISCSRDLL